MTDAQPPSANDGALTRGDWLAIAVLVLASLFLIWTALNRPVGYETASWDNICRWVFGFRCYP